MNVKAAVTERYGAIARRVRGGETGTCCGGSSSQASCEPDPITGNLYDGKEAALIPETALKASQGCGNPTALAALRPGEVVLDLGSGGGIDVLLSARRVGPTGRAYGLDATEDMLALAEENKRKSGLQNVEFLRGEIEHIPLPNASVDVVISNCVINLSVDKDQVLREAFRVLRPGGRLAVSDVLVQGELPEVVRRSMEAWVGCIAGALEEHEYRDKLKTAGFQEIDVEVTRVHKVEDARSLLSAAGLDPEKVAREARGTVVSAFVRAVKPADQV